ncbi:CgeB family protein [Occallatibacter savannae]|uniref:CgeB family protein n=1 Tax=Occallatibacter savannae TaxID=1002691 RepID=UPI000D698074|nr:glycosyltransferase [Occallatibacter savannae]
MSRKFQIAYFAHAIRSDWNNGNAHFLRGLLRSLGQCRHNVTVYEPDDGWSIENLRQEKNGRQSLQQFATTYPELQINTYCAPDLIGEGAAQRWRSALRGKEIVILHEWNPPELAHLLLELRDELGFRLLFHDTHHRASSSPEQIRLFGTDKFDGVLAFGEALRTIYRHRFNIQRVWTLHEAADTTVFRPIAHEKQRDVVWIGNWGDDERSVEICQFLLHPASELRQYRFSIYGVRYPGEALRALNSAGVEYGGYLPNLDGPPTYAASRLTMHIPRQQYVGAMSGIPTIRVFEALASGIPLISAPWPDTEQLFREGDFLYVRNAKESVAAIEHLLGDHEAVSQQAQRGLQTVLARHTCMHRAQQLTEICEEVIG